MGFSGGSSYSGWGQDGYNAYGDSSAQSTNQQSQEVVDNQDARPAVAVQASRTTNQRISTASHRGSVLSKQAQVQQVRMGSLQSHSRPPQPRVSGGGQNGRLVVGTNAGSASSRFLGPHLW